MKKRLFTDRLPVGSNKRNGTNDLFAEEKRIAQVPFYC
jgi:hypothetical protein